LRIVPPVFPYRGVRGVDSWGVGGFGSPRDGGSRRHLGLDFLGRPGEQIVASIPGVVGSLGFMYTTSPEMRNVHIIGAGEYDGYHILAGYVEARPGLTTGEAVKIGEIIGTLQDVAAYHRRRDPSHPGDMRNHCHLGLKVNGEWVDPAHYLPHDLPRI
jgi:hypothetical protein